MKITNKIAVLILALVAFCAPSFAQQAFLGQTTLAAAIQGQYLGSVSGANVPAPTLVQVSSATSIVGINPNLSITASQPNQTYLYIGREQMRVTAVNGTALTVVRGVNGTVATPHPSGDMVLFGPARFFYVMDPGGVPSGSSGDVSGVACTQANVQVSPWLNIRTGAQWLCSSVTGTWVPGWNNSAQGAGYATASVASVAGTTIPSGPLFTMTGTNAIVNFGTPVGFNATASGGGCFTAIPTAIWTWTAAGNISTAGTVTAGNSVPVTFCWNALTSKWVPSRIA